MIKEIKVINLKSNNNFNCLTKSAFVKKYGRSNVCENQLEQIAYDNNDYLLMFDNEIGFKSLPTNNINVQVGIDQNGETFLNNYYSSRQLLFTINVYDSSFIHLNDVLFQDNNLIKLQIKSESDKIFETTAVLVGSFETGNLEFKCVGNYSAFFNLPNELNTKSIILNKSQIGTPLIPQNGFNVNRFYFISGEDSNTVEFDVVLYGLPKLKIEGQYENFTISNLTTNSVLRYDGLGSVQTIINSEEQTTIVDDVNVTNLVRGEYPKLTGGQNRIRINFLNQISETVILNIEWSGVSSNVY